MGVHWSLSGFGRVLGSRLRVAGLWIRLVWARLTGRDYRQQAQSNGAGVQAGHGNSALVGPIPRLYLRHLLNKYYALPDEVKREKTVCGAVIALGVARHYLGLDWIERNIDPDARNLSHLSWMKHVGAEATIQVFRSTDLGELLFNLQNVAGFDELIERMKTGDIELYLAELRVGRLLYVNDVNFKFVIPRGTVQKDYDLEITHPSGAILCADTKCKIEATSFSESTIMHSLRQARKQLPRNGSGVVYVMVPGTWLDLPGSQGRMIKVAQDFLLRNTTRIVMVTYYSEPLSYSSGIMRQGHRFKEIQNPRRPEQDWSLLSYRPLGESWDALPEKWIRLVNFPEEVRNYERS